MTCETEPATPPQARKNVVSGTAMSETNRTGREARTETEEPVTDKRIALDELSPKEREAYETVEMQDGVGLREFARRTDRSHSTINTLLRRARWKLESAHDGHAQLPHVEVEA